MSLWVYFLAYAPCSKEEHVNNIWVSFYVLKGIPIWLFFICLIFNSKELTFFCLQKNQLGSCNNSRFRLLSWILKLLASEGVYVETKLGSIMSQKKFNSVTICLVAFTHLDFRRGQHFLSYKRPIWVNTFLFRFIYNLKFLMWPCWVKTHKEPKRVSNVKHF
jgi:hypothetical protein